MGKVYSQEVRLLVLAALDKGQSKMSVHRTLGVSRSTIDNWVRLREDTGTVSPQRRLPSARRAFPDLEAFESFALRHCEATLSQMKVAWQREGGLALSLMAFLRALKSLGWTRKKRVFFTKSERPPNARTLKNN